MDWVAALQGVITTDTLNVTIPGSIAVTGPLTDVQLRATAVPTSAAGNTSSTGIIDANAEAVAITVPPGAGGVGIQITGTWSGQIDFQGRIAAGAWVAVNTSNGVNSINATAFNGLFVTAAAGYIEIRAVSTSWVSGSATVTMNGSVGTGPVLLSAPLPQGTNLLGSISNAYGLETTQLAQMSRADTFKTRVDTFTTTANGTTVDVSASPMSAFTVQVKATGSVTSWDVRVEGSLNNSEFTTILSHTNVTGDGVVLWTGALEAPTMYFRSRAAGLVLGAGTNIVVTILGQN